MNKNLFFLTCDFSKVIYRNSQTSYTYNSSKLRGFIFFLAFKSQKTCPHLNQEIIIIREIISKLRKIIRQVYPSAQM